MIDFSKLCAPFPASRISWRVGSTNKDKTRGMALAFIDARDVMERLDEVCGPGGWQCDYPHANGKTVCRIGIKVGDEWIWKADGAGDTDFEAEKGALSDAFKRSAVRWGIGRYLYDVDAPWVEIEPAGKSFKIKQSEYAKLERLLPGARVDAPRDDGPDPAQVYVEAALTAIKSFKGSKAALRDWWNGEGPARRDNNLSQTHIDILRGKLTERADELEKETA